MVQLWHRAGFSARHSPSPPEPQGHFQTPWDHTVHQQTYREGYPNSQDTPSRLYAGPPTERHTPPARRGEGWLEKPLSCSGISWPTWFLRGSCCSQRSRSSLYWGWGSQSGFSSDDLPFQGRWSQPRGHHWSVGSSAVTSLSWLEVIFQALQARMPSSGWPGPAPEGAKGKAAGKRSGIQPEEKVRPEGRAQDSPKHPRPSLV